MLETVTIGTATLHLGDCREMLKNLRDGAANWCVTSPPYNLNKAHHSSQNAATAANKAMRAKYEDWYDDDMDEAEYQAEQKRSINGCLARARIGRSCEPFARLRPTHTTCRT